MTNGQGVDLAERGHQVAVVNVPQVVDVTKEAGLVEQVRHEMDLVPKSTRLLDKSLGDVIGRHVPSVRPTGSQPRSGRLQAVKRWVDMRNPENYRL